MTPIEDRLDGIGATLFDDIVESMEEALQRTEELGGPEGEEYIQLMQAVSDEAEQRIENYRRAYK